MTRIQNLNELLVSCFFISLLFGAAVTDLRSDLREFAALIPRRRVGYIAVRYYLFDPNFRIGLDYMRSSEFQDTWRQISETQEFFQLLNYVTKNATNGYTVTHLVETMPNRLRSLQLPSKVPVDMLIEQRNLGNFLKDVVDVLPRRRIANLMAQKVQENGDYAQFYRAARSSEFKKLVYEARHSENLAKSLQQLTENHINVDDITDVGFQLLKWGP